MATKIVDDAFDRNQQERPVSECVSVWGGGAREGGGGREDLLVGVFPLKMAAVGSAFHVYVSIINIDSSI